MDEEDFRTQPVKGSHFSNSFSFCPMKNPMKNGGFLSHGGTPKIIHFNGGVHKKTIQLLRFPAF